MILIKNIILSSIIIGVLLSEQIIFHFDRNFLISCTLTDPQSNYLPLKFPNP